jgi:hypothetical protein
MRLIWIIGGGALAWFAFGSPASNLAGAIWGDRPAPWESVDAFYYPDRSNLSRSERSINVGSLESCRAWVAAAAAKRNDPQVRRGDYECGVGYLRDFGDLRVYRVTTR